MIDTIVDLNHNNSIDVQAAKDGGVIAVIHKATEGATWRDEQYHKRRTAAKAIGLLWGAYHFATPANVLNQVDNFLTHAMPEDDELIALDFEPAKSGNMTLAQARDFVQIVQKETGRWPVLYGGDYLVSSVGHAVDPILSNCPLWYARYTSAPIGIPTQIWPNYSLWQFSDGNHPKPYHTPGLGFSDRSCYQGSTADLKKAWPLTRKVGAVA